MKLRQLNNFYLAVLLLMLTVLAYELAAQSNTFHNYHQQIKIAKGSAKKRFIALQKFVDGQNTMTEQEKLEKVNRFFNLFEFVSDIKFNGKTDYWQTPNEFIYAAAGDCEDFSIAKYFTLISMGVNKDKLKIVYVKATTLNQAHMVLAYYPKPDAEPLILDNIKGEILPASKRQDLIPVYSFNIDGIWLVDSHSQGRKLGNSNKLRKWQDLLNRMQKEDIP